MKNEPICDDNIRDTSDCANDLMDFIEEAMKKYSSETIRYTLKYMSQVRWENCLMKDYE